MRIGFRLAYADPGRDIPKATVFILCTYTSTKYYIRLRICLSFPHPALLCSALLASPLLVLSLLSLYPAVLDGASFPHPTLLCSALLSFSLLSLHSPSSTALPSTCPLVDGDAIRLSYK
jgi:hypothetical protein